MENFHDLVINRRSIRRYTDQQLDPEQVKLILEAALMAPTSKNSRSWHFVLVEDKETLEKLSQCKKAGALPVKNATLAVVVTVNPEQSEAWVEDGSIAAAYMQLQATDLGLGSCWIEVAGRHAADGTPAEEIVRNELDIPEEMRVLCIATFGYKDEERKPMNTEKLLWEQVHTDKW